MNAPAKIPSARDQYRPQVRRFMPGCEGRELELRCSLLLLRDQATSRMRNCGGEAYDVCALIVRLVCEYALASMPIERLEELRYEAVRLATCASGLDMFASKLCATDEAAGGQNAGG